MRRSLVVALATALVFAGAVEARADPETARRHFDLGKELRDRGECARAIPEFERSVAAEKSIGALYNLAYCNEELGRRQTAYEDYKQAQALASAKKDERLREISGALAALLETPHIRLVLPQPLPQGMTVKVDEDPIPPASYQTEMVVFTRPTKSHMVLVTAPGYEERRESIDTRQLRAIVLNRIPDKVEATKPASPRTGGWTPQHWLGVSGIVAGAASFTIGAVVGITYLIDESRLLNNFNELKDQTDAAKAQCSIGGPTPNLPACTTPQQTNITDLTHQRDQAKNDYQANEDKAKENEGLIIGTLVGGGLLIGGGIFLLSTAPKTSSPPPATRTGWRVVPMLGPTRRGISIGATF